MNTFTKLFLAAALITVLGCGEPEATDQQASNVGVAAPPPLAPPPVVVQPAKKNPPAVTDTPAEINPPVVDENTEAVTAEVGFGKKGHYDSNDYISVAVSTQFRVQEQITLLRVTQAMRQFKAINQRYPKTHDEFWKEIIVANSISFPELKNGEILRYDPDLAEETDGEQSLQILRPKKQ